MGFNLSVISGQETQHTHILGHAKRQRSSHHVSAVDIPSLDYVNKKKDTVISCDISQRKNSITAGVLFDNSKDFSTFLAMFKETVHPIMKILLLFHSHVIPSK